MRSKFIALVAILFVHGAIAQDTQPELTLVGKAILRDLLASEGHAVDGSSGVGKPMTFPLAMCTFSGGLCGAVRRDGTVAVPPRYDWVGPFAENRAAVRLHGLYGFVDEDGRETVQPQYRIVEDYHFGFAEVDVDGKSGIIDRDGKMVIEPKYGSINAIGPDRFRVTTGGSRASLLDAGSSDIHFLRGGGADASGMPIDSSTGIIDLSGRWIEPLLPSLSSLSSSFDKNDSSLRWTRKDKLWGLAHADGSWLIEPKFQRVDSLSDGLAGVTLDGKVGFIDRSGAFAIAPVFDWAWSFKQGFGRTSVRQDGIVGVIDKTGAWVFRTDYQELRLATTWSKDRGFEAFGWHFKKNDKWGLLDLDGRVLFDAEFDRGVQQCNDGRLVAYKNKEWLYFKADGSPLQPPDGRLIDAACGSKPPYTLKVGNKLGLVDAASKPLTPMQFDAFTAVGSGVRNVEMNGKWGRIGPDGHWLLEPKFDYLSGGLDLFVASIDGTRGFMRSDGSWLIQPKFDAARRRDDDTAFVTLSGATGVLRLKDQSWTIPPRPGVMCDIHSAIVWQRNGTRAILSPAGDTWIDIGSERIGINLDYGLLTFLKDGKWGLVDTAGQVMVEPQFDEPVYFTPGWRGTAWAKRGSNWCAVDRRGHQVSDINCRDADPQGTPSSPFVCRVEP
jgi:WG repeat protein